MKFISSAYGTTLTFHYSGLQVVRAMTATRVSLDFLCKNSSISPLDFGFGKSGMSDVISDEGLQMVKHLSAFEGEDFLVDQTFNIAIVNILWQIVSGSKFKVQSMSQ